MSHTYFVDLHIHIGRTETGKPVKITGSRTLTLSNILEEASRRKGMDLVGIIDCHVPEVLAELNQLIREEKAFPLPGGGITYNQTTLILGTEMEINDTNCRGPVHVLCFFPTIEVMSTFSQWMSQHQKNITLSSQRSYVSARELQQKVKELEGLFIPAHIFTPFKSLYGKGVKQSLTEIFDPQLIDAVELGLSSDTSMADQITELHSYTFLTNSDAHSVAKIGREYQMMALDEPDFTHLKQAIRGSEKQKIVANYGLNPKLGKYHQEVSERLRYLEKHQMVEGAKILTEENTYYSTFPIKDKRSRPPYVHQIPLEYIPHLGAKGLQKLIEAFGSEMSVIHSSTRMELEKWVRPEVASIILEARQGKVDIQIGGAGKYGKLTYKRQP
jgi:uncharacterized protein (TIGR00375 family)